MQIGVSSYSYSKLVRCGKITELDGIQITADLGFDVIEFSTLNLPQDQILKEFAPIIKKSCQQVNLPIANYTIGADFINGSNGDTKREVERVKDEVRIAHLLGAPGIRHDATRGFESDYKGKRSFDAALEILVPAIRELTDFAAKLGIKTMVENHGFFCQDSERIEQLINAVNHENFGILIDIGNFLCVDEPPDQAVGRLIPYAFHIHAKDFYKKSGQEPDPGEGWFRTRGGNYLKGTIVGHGDVPLISCLDTISRYGYDNTLSIEFEGLEDPIDGIRIGLANLKNYLGYE